jgi:hypothetical protein
MPVQLRAVPSPPLEIATSAPPRIRFAGAATPVAQPGAMGSIPVGQAALFTPTQGGVVQTVQVTELPPAAGYPPGGVPSVASGPPAGPSVSPDGFRPRGSIW